MPALCDGRLEPGALAFGCGWPCMGDGGVDGRREPGWLPATDPAPDPDPEAALDPGLPPGPAGPIPLLDEVCLDGGVAGLAPDARGEARPEAGPPVADPDALGRWLLGPPDMLGRWLGPPEVLGRWLGPPLVLGRWLGPPEALARWEVALGPPEALGHWLAAPEVLCRWLATPPAWLDRLLEPPPVVLLRAVEGGCGWAGGCRRAGGGLGLLSVSTRPLPLALCRGALSGEGEALAPLVVSPSMRPRREGAAGFAAPGRDGAGEANPTRAVPGGLACPGRGLAGGAGPPGRMRAGPGDAGRAGGPPGTAVLGLAPAGLRGEGGARPAAEWGRCGLLRVGVAGRAERVGVLGRAGRSDRDTLRGSAVEPPGRMAESSRLEPSGVRVERAAARRKGKPTLRGVPLPNATPPAPGPGPPPPLLRPREALRGRGLLATLPGGPGERERRRSGERERRRSGEPVRLGPGLTGREGGCRTYQGVRLACSSSALRVWGTEVRNGRYSV